MTRASLAKRVPMSYSMLSDLFTGHAKSTAKLHRIAEVLKARVDWLETGACRGLLGDDGEWRGVPAYAVESGLGEGIMPDEYAEMHRLRFRADSLHKMGLHAPNLRICFGKGNSMLPRIHDGDALLYDTTDARPLQGGKIYIVNMDGHEGLVAKRVIRIGEGWFLEALNRAAPGWGRPRALDLGDAKVLGRVRWIGSWEA